VSGRRGTEGGKECLKEASRKRERQGRRSSSNNSCLGVYSMLHEGHLQHCF
jgi:hypothetical protein